MLTQMLKAMGQADGVIIKMEKQIAQMDDSAHAEVFGNTVKLNRLTVSIKRRLDEEYVSSRFVEESSN